MRDKNHVRTKIKVYKLCNLDKVKLPSRGLFLHPLLIEVELATSLKNRDVSLSGFFLSCQPEQIEHLGAIIFEAGCLGHLKYGINWETDDCFSIIVYVC